MSRSDDVDPVGATVSATRADTTVGGPVRASIFAERVGRYVLDEELGRGGMGAVFRAHDPDLDRPVAIKLLHAELGGARTRLLREGQAIARLSHPNVVAVYDVGGHGDGLFIAMELVDGGTLRSWQRAEKRTSHEIIAAFIAAGRGLAAAHAAGLVHRDFKPENVLVARNGRVVVSDFGIAQEVAATASPGPSADANHTATVAGTPAYMSPEQLRGERGDARSDQFSFCVALWEALYGARPFEVAKGASFEELAAVVSAGRLRPVVRRRDLPARVHAALVRGLSPHAKDRFPSMESLLAQLGPRRRTWWIAAGIVVAMAAAVAIGIAVAPSRETRQLAARDPSDCAIPSVWDETTRAAYLASATDADAAREDAGWFDGYARRLVGERASVCVGDRIAGVDRSPRSDCLDRALDDLRAAIARPAADRPYWPELDSLDACAHPDAAPEVTRITDVDWNDRTRMSPAGDRFVTENPSGQIERGGDGSTVAMPSGLTSVRRWLPNGDLIGRTSDGALVKVDAATGSVSPRLAWDRIPRDRALDISNDLRWSLTYEAGLRVTPFAGGASVVVPLSEPFVAWPRFTPDGRVLVIAATVTRGFHVHVIDPASGTDRISVLRLLNTLSGAAPVIPLDDHWYVTGGAAGPGRNYQLWRARYDGAAAPEILRRGERNVELLVEDAWPGKVAVVAVEVGHRFDDMEDGQVKSSMSQLAGDWPASLDVASATFLASRDNHSWTASLRDFIPHPVDLSAAHLADDVSLRLRGTRVVGLERRGDGEQRYFELAAAGTVARSIPLGHEHRLLLDCGGGICVVAYIDGGIVVARSIDDNDLGPPQRLAVTAHVPLSPGTQIVLSPDGGTLAVLAQEPKIDLFDLSTGVRRTLVRTECRQFQLASFAPGGARLFATCSSGYGFSIVELDLEHPDHQTVVTSGPDYPDGILAVGPEAFLVSMRKAVSTLERIDLP